ncbi:nucleotide kinase [Enterococcus phage vB_EfaP_Ef7.3]|uniref:Uncharacterized protein n=1 Tax=Enterococcus phage vB_EfaP_Ef7.3 TaxID=2546619 RepID=A0A4D6DSF8_9CAUD|nr:nucleotide kinase [Enterococcus phage vB_EfaP_Ef7.3]QBZ69068.1 hypothetical protein [Enterococcus phage vB_EfaP_Ef7.3]
MIEKCGIGEINNMRELVYLKCQYCGEGFNELRRFLGHENFCKKKKGANDMKKFINRCRYCNMAFGVMEDLWLHEVACDKLTTDESLNQDNVKPNHYKQGKEDLIEMWYRTMTLEQFRGAMKSNIIKYTMRYENKNGIEDLNKAMEYLERLKKYEENELNRN